MAALGPGRSPLSSGFVAPNGRTYGSQSEYDALVEKSRVEGEQAQRSRAAQDAQRFQSAGMTDSAATALNTAGLGVPVQMQVAQSGGFAPAGMTSVAPAMTSGGGVGGGGGAVGGGAGITTTSAPDPNSLTFLNQIRNRIGTQQAAENAPVTASAERATDLANRDIYDSAAGAKKARSEELAARGLRTDVGVGAGSLRSIDEAAQTRSARSASDIAVKREQDQDALNLARTQQVNSLYGQYGGASQVPFQQQLQGSELALKAAGQADDASIRRAQLAQGQQSSQLDTWLRLMSSL